MISIKYHSGIYTLEVSQFLKIAQEDAWNFFSSPGNLSKITPPSMGFVITSGPAKRMYAGQIISYRVSPFAGFRSNWVTEITRVEEGRFFVDEQRFGPYRMWHHEHIFEPKDSGVLMTDRISYKLPMGILGRLAHSVFVRKKLRRIFEFREITLNQLFN